MGQAPFLTARPHDERMEQSVRPMIVNRIEDNLNIEVKGVKAVMIEDEATGLLWWTLGENENAEEEESIGRNPCRRWADEDVDDREGLGQDGIRPDPQSGGNQEESRKPKKNTKVHTPTREEVEDHERHHCPFRAWCRHCVKGRGMNAQHRKKTESEENSIEGGKVPRVSID